METWASDTVYPAPQAFAEPLPDVREIALNHSLPLDPYESPGILLALEHDCLNGYDRFWWPITHVSRCLQFSQWTMMARPNHPIFLDAVRHGLYKYKEVREREAMGEEYHASQLDILNWFGPGALSVLSLTEGECAADTLSTDAVFRYLLVRHGVHPRELRDITQPVRYGDITILPEGSFGAIHYPPWFYEHKYKAVYHGGYGRWRTKYEGPVKSRPNDNE